MAVPNRSIEGSPFSPERKREDHKNDSMPRFKKKEDSSPNQEKQQKGKDKEY